MIDVQNLRIFVCAMPTNMGYSFDSLMGLAQEIFNQDPTSGHLFVFFNRVRDRVKILCWDQDGFCIWYKKQATEYTHFYVFTAIAGTDSFRVFAASASDLDQEYVWHSARRHAMPARQKRVRPGHRRSINDREHVCRFQGSGKLFRKSKEEGRQRHSCDS